MAFFLGKRYKAGIYLVGEGGGEAKSEESYDYREIGMWEPHCIDSVLLS